MIATSKLACVILAAGQGKRMKSDLPKVLHKVGEYSLVEHVIGQASGVGSSITVVIVGHGRDQVIPILEKSGAGYAIQSEQLCTGHAVRMAEEQLSGFDGDILVLSGDVPLLSVETLTGVIAYHREQEAVATLITAIAPDPTGYGRVLRDSIGNVSGIREHKDCSEAELKIDEINAGIYLFRSKYLFEALKGVSNQNAQGEYYLPDVLLQYFKDGDKVTAIAAKFDEIHGINTPEDLASAEAKYQNQSSCS